ncbi:MAG: hypothetical protein K9G62_04545 [Alphaproteobacteria bacterium]|nr:hypothetical protein [Alphaproteobacteria bacterium]
MDDNNRKNIPVSLEDNVGLEPLVPGFNAAAEGTVHRCFIETKIHDFPGTDVLFSTIKISEGGDEFGPSTYQAL